MAFLLISILLFTGYAALLLYYRLGWTGMEEEPATEANQQQRQTSSGINFHPPPALHNNPQLLISVIIPARNEANNIGACLQSVCSQSLPAHLFEIIVADDFSEDATAAIVRSCKAPNLQLLSLADLLPAGHQENAYKKRAIEAGIAAARGQLIVTTDADCIASPHWLSSIAAFYQRRQPAFIAAPVLVTNGNAYVEIFQSLDFLTLQGITGASVYKKFHTMCNGANLAYERSVFYEVNGFAGIDHIASGDDMLLMHKIYERYPGRVFYLKSRAAIVHTAPVHNWKDFFRQRIRWASKAGQYKDKRILPALVVVYLFNVLLLSLFIAGWWNPRHWWLLAALLVCKTAVELFFLWPVAGFFGKKKLLWWFPVSQPVHIVYTIIAGWLGQFGRYEWKGRRVR
jgi:glycosyltransferase involved in cell wall biosynthesis